MPAEESDTSNTAARPGFGSDGEVLETMKGHILHVIPDAVVRIGRVAPKQVQYTIETRLLLPSDVAAFETTVSVGALRMLLYHNTQPIISELSITTC